MNNSKRKFYQELKKHFCALNIKDKKYLEDLKYRIDLFENEKPEANFSDYILRFGEPIDIATSYYENIDSNSCRNKFSFNKSLVFLFAITILITVFYTCFAFNSYIEGKNYYITLREVVITEKN